jgi:hypothetical protein
MRRGRSFAVVAVGAIALGVAIGLAPSVLPRHGGWWGAGLLLVLGFAFGSRAVVLPFLVCVPWGLLAQATSKCVYECDAWVLLVTLIPAAFCVPALVGAAVRGAMRLSRRRPLSDGS